MHAVALMSGRVGGVSYYPGEISTTPCRIENRMLDISFRVCAPRRENYTRCVYGRGTKYVQMPHRISNFELLRCDVYHKKDLSTRSERRSCSGPRAQVPGDLSLISETVRDVRDVQELSVLKTDYSETAEVQDDVVALGYGWKVREASRFDTEELRAVAHVQATSFHLQAAVFDELFFKLFKAEVLSALLYKARHSPPDRYACLLAEPATALGGEESGDTFFPIVVGAVNLAAAVDNEVLRHLHSATEYLYVSGMAVDINYRRRNVASMLLRACELLAMKWGFDYLVLHAYEDDMAARTLYSRGGYRVIALDPLWMSTWIGRKRRVLMAKRTSITPNFDF